MAQFLKRYIYPAICDGFEETYQEQTKHVLRLR